jgi:Ca2+-binding EF-hand superfamily protein
MAAAALAALDADRIVRDADAAVAAGLDPASLSSDGPPLYAPAPLPVDEAAGVSATNWFTAATAIRVYTQYLDLDADQNGLLAPHELARAYGGTLTDAFVGRLFQVANTYGGEMDFKAYLDFVLASEYRRTPASMRYIFRALDADGAGALTLPTLRRHFGEVAAKMAAAGHDPVDEANACDEAFDMTHPATPGRITLEDIRASGCGHTLLHILTDAAGFWQYDNREFLLQQQGKGGQEDADASAGAPPTAASGATPARPEEGPPAGSS